MINLFKRKNLVEYVHSKDIKLKLYAPNNYWDATIEQKKEVCNGCGAKGGIKVPNSFLGLDISIACNIHDWMYQYGETHSDRIFADAMFRTNLSIIIEDIDTSIKGKILSIPRHFAAGVYYASVVKWGKSAFWVNKPDARKLDLEITFKGRFQVL